MWYDILVGCILLFFLARGAARGLVWQLAGILGILLCITFAGTASKVIGPHINLPQPTNQWAVMFITYLLASLVAFGFARTLNGWIEKMEMKEYNRHLGAVFGLLKGALLVLILTFMIVTFSEKSRRSLKDSHSAHIAARMIHQIEPLIPDKLNAAVGKYIQMFDATGFVAHDPNEEAGVEEILPPEFGGMGQSAPVDDGTSLGKAEPFDPFGVFPNSSPQRPGTPAASDLDAISPDLATELRKTVGTKASRLIEEELLALTPQMKARLEQNITDALQSADPQSRRQLQERLLDQGQDGLLVQLLDDWAAELLASGDAMPPARPPVTVPARPTTTRLPLATTPASQTPTPETNGPRTTLDEIVATKSQFPSIQKKLKAEYTLVLQMLPQTVSSAVIEDWYGDLTNSATDVDPETDSRTPLETRIINQLGVAGYPESKLQPALQARLKQFRMTAEGSGVLR
jgi:uncharacterized membrane protein required for colicin V production